MKNNGKKVKIIVRSADEAVRLIKEKLGSKAKVLSVKQVEGEGLARFLKAPRLEVIAVLDDAASEASKDFKDSKSFPVVDNQEDKEFLTPHFSLRTRPQEKEGSLKKSIDSHLLQNGKLKLILSRLGLDEGLLNDLSFDENWEKWESMPLSKSIHLLGKSLMDRYNQSPKRDFFGKVALFGTPGSGVTTALCKLLSQAVFLRHESIEVLKFEAEGLNSDEALKVFCEVLGAPVHRDPIDRPHLNSQARLFIDVPGLPMLSKDWNKVKRNLDELGVDNRVLVINAAYEADLVYKLFQLGISMEATHVLFTHLDEVDNIFKLWRFFMRARLTPLGLSTGQSITSDFVNDPLPWLLERSFPNEVLKMSAC